MKKKEKCVKNDTYPYTNFIATENNMKNKLFSTCIGYYVVMYNIFILLHAYYFKNNTAFNLKNI